MTTISYIIPILSYVITFLIVHLLKRKDIHIDATDTLLLATIIFCSMVIVVLIV
jgi:uncharacterized membrane protein YoaK (UPF0700 family)